MKKTKVKTYFVALKREVLKDLENFDMSTVCKIVAGAFERAITYKKETL